MRTFFIIYLTLANLAGFLLFGADKRKARKHKWRISERSLFLAAILGGSVGCLIGMFFFHHKTRHWYFRIGIPLILILQILLLLGGIRLSEHLTERSNARAAIRTEFSKLRSGNMKIPETAVDLSDSSASKIQEILPLFYEHFDYRIQKLDLSYEAGTGTALIRFTTPDAKSLAKDFLLACRQKQLRLELEENAEVFGSDTAWQILHTLLTTRKYNTITTDGSVSLLRSKTKWQVQRTAELENAVTGNFAGYLADGYLLSPEETLNTHLDAICSLDTEQLIRYFNLESIFSNLKNEDSESDLTRAFATQLRQNLAYEILKSDINSDTAVVSLKITSLDCSNILREYQKKALEYTQTSQALSDGQTVRQNTIRKYLADCVAGNTKSCTTECDITMTNNDTGWVFTLDETLLNALLGNISNALTDMEE